jgi:hypothetical protein
MSGGNKMLKPKKTKKMIKFVKDLLNESLMELDIVDHDVRIMLVTPKRMLDNSFDESTLGLSGMGSEGNYIWICLEKIIEFYPNFQRGLIEIVGHEVRHFWQQLYNDDRETVSPSIRAAHFRTAKDWGYDPQDLKYEADAIQYGHEFRKRVEKKLKKGEKLG